MKLWRNEIIDFKEKKKRKKRNAKKTKK